MLSWNHLFLFIRVFSAVVAVSLLSVSCGNSPKAPRELDLTALDACGQYNEILELTAKLHPWQGPASYLDYVQRVAQAIPSFVSNRIDELSIQDFEDYQKAIPSESDVQEWSEYLSGCRMIVDLNDRGRALVASVIPHARAITEATLEPLNAVERVALLYLLSKLAPNGEVNAVISSQDA